MLAATFSFDATVFECKEQDIRYLGLAFQLAGFASVAFGILKIRQHFGKPTLLSRIGDYWRGRPRLHRETHHLKAEGLSATVSMGRARAYVSPGPKSSLERRVELLESTVKTLHKEVGELGSRQASHEKETSAALKKEAGERQSADDSLKKSLDSAIADGVYLDWLGVMLFILGVVLATGSAEIAPLLEHPSACVATS